MSFLKIAPFFIISFFCFLAAPVAAEESSETGNYGPREENRLYLSRSGPDDAVPWRLVIDGGNRAGEQTTIPVPSSWETQGFGTYIYPPRPPAPMTSGSGSTGKAAP
jgi:hypothetical protein